MERDDLIQDNNYSISANHDEAHGVVIKKKNMESNRDTYTYNCY